MAERFASLYKLARNWRPDIAHFYLPGPYLVGAPAAIAAGVPIKVMSRRSSANYQRGRPIAAALERMLHPKMDVVIGNSAAVIRELRAERVSEEKLHLIYNGINMSSEPPNREKARRDLDIEPGVLVGVMVANLIHYKGHCDLLKGLISVAKQLPTQWHILLAGRDEGHKRQLQFLAAEGGIDENLKFLGECADTKTLLAAADFGLLTSHEEGFSNAVLEGMGAGLPMIVTDVGGNPEAVLDGTTGLVVPPRDHNAIGEAVLRLAGDAGLRIRLGEAARIRAQTEFSMTRCVTAHDELYRSLLDNAPPKRSSESGALSGTAD
jgi:glycosyltransferase involved in cell wall biosynthesis